jgi:hypothetical protein
MKTSFYFVLWITIYPILWTFNNSFVDQYSFVIALLAVIAITKLLNLTMPNILAYERITYIADILESVYTCNVTSFTKRVKRDTIIEAISAVYFVCTVIAIVITIGKGVFAELFALFVFGYFLYSSISRFFTLYRAYSLLKSEPTPENCVFIVDNVYQLDYASYYSDHEGRCLADMLPIRPKMYKLSAIVSFILAIVCALLGLIYMLDGVMTAITTSASAVGGMVLLYGTLAIYFGIKDMIECWHSIRNKAI